MKNNPYDIERAFAEIEDEIIKDMIRRLKKDRAKDSKAGWKDWRIRQLAGIKDFITSIRKKFGKAYKTLNDWIKEQIGKAFDDTIIRSIEDAVDTTESDGFFDINRTRMEALQKATVEDLERAEHAVFRKTNDEYRKIIYKAHVALNSGLAPSYDKAIDMATKDFLRAGINSVEYKNGSRHTVEEYAQMALRTAMKRASLMAEGEMRTRRGIHTVFASYRSMACPKCIQFLGQLMIDDVYSVGTREEADALGCITLSDAMSQGFLHPNCKDTVMTYDPELYRNNPERDPLRKAMTERETMEAQKRWELEVKETSAKHNVKVYTRMAENQLDEDNKRKYKARAEEWERKATDASKQLERVEEKAKGDTEIKATIEDITQKMLEEARPGDGEYIEDTDNDASTYEKSVGKWLLETFGGNIKVLARSNTAKSPEFLWRDAFWELKTPQEATKNAIDSRLHAGLKQIAENPGGVIVDIKNIYNGISVDEIMAVVKRRIIRSAKNGTRVMIINGNEAIAVYEIKK